MGTLVACDDVDPTPPAPQVVSVTVVPQNVQVSVGGTATLAATVVGEGNLTDRTVTWTSSNPAIATVDASGTVRGVAAGQTTILAKSNADPNVQGAAAVVVNAQSVPAVSIASITKGGLPIDITNVAGQIDVTLNLAPNGAVVSAVDVFAQCPGQTTAVRAAGQTFAGGNAPAGPITLSFNTARLNQAGSGPEWFNGACTISARLTSPQGTPQATPATLAATFNNLDAVVTQVTPSRGPAADGAGNPWSGGDVVVRVIPVLYSGATAGSVAVNFTGTTTTGEAVTKSATVSGPYPATVTFTGTAGARAASLTSGSNISQLTIPVAVVSTSATNASGIIVPTPGSLPVSFNYDSQAPANGAYVFGTQGTFASAAEGNWVGTGYQFAAGNNAGSLGYSRATTSPMAPFAGAGTLAGNDQAGVDRTTVVFQAANVDTNNQTCSATGLTFTTVTSGSNLPSSTVNGTQPAGPSYCLRIIETDALGNADTTLIAAPNNPFGVDRENPSLIATAGVAANSSFNISGTDAVPSDAFPVAGNTAAAATATYAFTLRDTLSGFDATAVNYSITLLTPSAIATGSTLCVVGTFTAPSTCAPVDGTGQTFTVDSTDRTFRIPVTGGSALAGYYTFNGTFRDRAANAGAAALPTRVVLLDGAAPTVSRIGVTTTGVLAGNSTVTFNFDATDNVDLYLASSVLTYPAVAVIRSATQQIGTPFDATLTTATPAAGQPVTFANFFRSLTAAPGTAGVKPTSINVRVTDAATNEAVGTARAIDPQDVQTSDLASPPAAAGAGTFADATVGVQTFSIVSAQSGTAASPNCTAGTTCTITVRLQGPTGTFVNPFAGGGVNLYVVVGGELMLLQQQTAGAQTDNGTNRFYTYTFSVPTPAAGPWTVQAIGFTAKGDGLLSNAFPVTVAPAP